MKSEIVSDPASQPASQPASLALSDESMSGYRGRTGPFLTPAACLIASLELSTRFTGPIVTQKSRSCLRHLKETMTRQGGVGVSTGTTGVLGKAVTKPWENGFCYSCELSFTNYLHLTFFSDARWSSADYSGDTRVGYEKQHEKMSLTGRQKHMVSWAGGGGGLERDVMVVWPCTENERSNSRTG
ncbi:hypothetical protein C0Q70_07456 [Pomacea canaliculata]|uniref:Uncharacterized protein n=1 Tax=Pomacea canaliculata TaxID=400727 RepID=A0A2T7PF44_POMCA|nr:hypothetical protein C0Q70_07456 [Pomacea canaliculata]